MAGNEPVACDGCGGLFPPIDGPTHQYMESSPGCAAAAGMLFARHSKDFAAYFDVYRLATDAYAVQHPGDRFQRNAARQLTGRVAY